MRTLGAGNYYTTTELKGRFRPETEPSGEVRWTAVDPKRALASVDRDEAHTVIPGLLCGLLTTSVIGLARFPDVCFGLRVAQDESSLCLN